LHTLLSNNCFQQKKTYFNHTVSVFDLQFYVKIMTAFTRGTSDQPDKSCGIIAPTSHQYKKRTDEALEKSNLLFTEQFIQVNFMKTSKKVLITCFFTCSPYGKLNLKRIIFLCEGCYCLYLNVK